MAAGDGFDEQVFVDAINATREEWLAEAINFIATLESISTSQLTLDLPNTLMPIGGLGTIYDDFRTRVTGEPVKPTGLDYVSPTDPGPVPPVDVGDIETVNVPTLGASPPAIDIPDAPDLETLVPPTTPVLKNVVTPDAPDIVLPDAPVITAIEFPAAPQIQLPTFSESFPIEEDILLQTTSFDYSEGIESTPTLDIVQDKVEGDLLNGGYGIEPDDEQALYDRVRDREVQAAISGEEDALRSFAARGNKFPPGAASALVDNARREARERISEANREIAVNRADLFRKTREFAITQGIAVESERLRYAGFRLERVLNAARFAAEFAINVFDAEIRKRNIKLQAYSTFVEGYAAQVQAALTQVEIFRSQVQAAVEQQRAKQIEVELYNAIINSANSRVSLFEAQVRGALLEVDIERLRMDTFRSEVEAFTARVSSQNQQMRVYETQIRGEQAKTDVFSSQVDAFRSQVEAARVESDVRNRDVELNIQKARIELDGFEAEVRKFATLVAAEDSRVRALISEYSTDTQSYAAALSAWEGLSRTVVASNQQTTEAVRERIRLEQINADTELQATNQNLQLQFQAANAGANITRDIIIALQSAVNALSGKITE
jgi:hypothetical protein